MIRMELLGYPTGRLLKKAVGLTTYYDTLVLLEKNRLEMKISEELPIQRKYSYMEFKRMAMLVKTAPYSVRDGIRCYSEPLNPFGALSTLEHMLLNAFMTAGMSVEELEQHFDYHKKRSPNISDQETFIEDGRIWIAPVNPEDVKNFCKPIAKPETTE